MSSTRTPEARHQVDFLTLPEEVRHLSHSTKRPVIKREFLFFREGKPTFEVPEIAVRGKHDSWGPFALEYRLYHLLQNDSSLAVYAYLFDESSAAGRSYGCLYVGCIRHQDWTLGDPP